MIVKSIYTKFSCIDEIDSLPSYSYLDERITIKVTGSKRSDEKSQKGSRCGKGWSYLKYLCLIVSEL